MVVNYLGPTNLNHKTLIAKSGVIPNPNRGKCLARFVQKLTLEQPNTFRQIATMGWFEQGDEANPDV